jgi:hypothetical protein
MITTKSYQPCEEDAEESLKQALIEMGFYNK